MHAGKSRPLCAAAIGPEENGREQRVRGAERGRFGAELPTHLGQMQDTLVLCAWH